MYNTFKAIYFYLLLKGPDGLTTKQSRLKTSNKLRNNKTIISK